MNNILSNDFEIFYEPGYRRNIDSFQVEVLRGKKQIKLDWKKPTDEVFSYKIFKGSSKDDLSLLKTIENPLTTTFSDIDISINNQYFYAIKYITKDGIHSIPLVKKVIY